MSSQKRFCDEAVDRTGVSCYALRADRCFFWAATALLMFGLTLQAQIDEAKILEGPTENWLTYSGDYASTRHSPLNQINASNVSSVVPKWVFHVRDATKLETTPLVYDGVMYISHTNEVYAVDAVTGRSIWHHRSDGGVGRQNRGVALWGDGLFFITVDCHLVKLDRVTGSLIWDQEFASNAEGYTSSLAPLVVKGQVLVGTAGGGSGQRGFVGALSASTGEELWRFWTVPGEGEPGSESWGGFPAKWSGAPTWTTGSYDPGLNLIYWPTGNPWPDFAGIRRRGDNLYSDSVVALDADTGELKWYFQFTPHDTHDWDANEQLVLIDKEFKGRMRKLMLHADRNGFYYVLDRATGEFLLGTPFVEKLDWATGLDAKGRPIEVPNLEPSASGVKVCPSVRGATNWMSPSINPDIGLLYVVTLEMCDIYTGSAKEPVPSSGFRGTGRDPVPTEPGQFYLRALDALTGEKKWEYEMTGPARMWGGTVSTAGGLVFTADDDGSLIALDARSGEELWHFSTGHEMFASPMTFMAEGKQYVTIAAETDVYTFGLFEPVD